MPEGEQTPPAQETPPVSAPSEVAEHVAEAATSATEAAQETGVDGWKVVADELKGLRGDIKDLMSRSPSPAITPATTPQPEPPAQATTPAEPEVNVETPKPQDRKVRRGGRKVTRRGK